MLHNDNRSHPMTKKPLRELWKGSYSSVSYGLFGVDDDVAAQQIAGICVIQFVDIGILTLQLMPTSLSRDRQVH